MSGLESTGSLFPADTYSVSQLGEELQQFLGEAYGSVWVVGEVHRLRERNGHCYLELVEKGRGDRVLAKLDVVLFRSDRQRVERTLARGGQQLAEGQMLRCRGRVDYYPPFGRLQLVARDVDPMFTLGVLERRRQETVEWLRSSGLLERNAALELSLAPLRIGLVTADDSAAFHDFVSTLRQSGFGFEVAFAAASVQGAAAEGRLTAGLAALERHLQSGPGLDVVAIVRGGGSRTDLAAFDGRTLARAIATFPRPVVTGIGHETDLAIADRVSWRHFKTPTGVAEFLCARVAEVERVFVEAGLRLGECSRRRLRDGDDRLRRAAGRAVVAERRLASARRRLDALAGSLSSAARQELRGREQEVGALARRLPEPSLRLQRRREQQLIELVGRLEGGARRALSTGARQVETLSRLCQQVSPERIFERGFSLTLASDGRVIRSVTDVKRGSDVTTMLRDGSFQSVVDSITADERQEQEERR